MSDTTITPEERARLRAIAAKPSHLSHREGIHAALNNLLDALEQAEAQLAAALQVNAVGQAEVTAEILNSMMAGITGKKESVRVEVDGFQCPYCNEISKTIEAATAHDAICPKHPAVMRADDLERDLARVKSAGIEAMRRAEQAEARAERAEKELAGADAEISELRDELEDSRGTEKDAPNILCAIARLVGVYEHCQELGDDMGDMTLDAVRDLLAEKQTAEANVERMRQRVNELLSEELTDGAVRERIQLRFNMHEVLQQNERLTKMVQLLSEWCAQFESGHTLEEVGLALSNGMACPEPWQYADEAARRAVAAGEK